MKGLKGILAFTIMLFGVGVLFAQTPEWQWAVGAGGADTDYGESIAVDNAGNQYVTGYFRETANFGATTLTSSGYGDIFVCKMNAAGNYLWVQQAGGTDDDYGRGIAVDSYGNIYVTGYFRYTASFGATTLTSSGGRDIFVCKLDTNGNFLWATQAGGNLWDRGNNIALDSDGNSYVTGYFRETAIFGATTLTGNGYYDIFVCKLDINGNFLWAMKAGSDLWDEGYSIAVDIAGNCYVTGFFDGTASFGATTLTSSGEFDIFVCKLDADGNFLWVKQAGGTGYDGGLDIAVDSAGNCYVTGYFEGSVSFGATTLTSSGELDIFVCKLDPNGNFLWAKQAGGIDGDCGYSIAVVSNGNSYVTGDFYGTACFGDITLTSSGYSDIFACKLDPNGNFLWANKAGGIDKDYGESIAVDSAGNIYVTGWFEGTAIFGATSLTSNGDYDIFVCKLGSGTPVDDPTVPELAGDPILYPAWPNPCLLGQSASIKAVVAERETGTLSIYNLRGELISRRELASGEHVISLDSRELPSGLYFFRLVTSSGVAVRKMAIIR